MRYEIVQGPYQDPDEVQLIGGLTVLQCGVAPSLRVEKQMRGRAGRQGDPGQSFAIAYFDDPSIRRHFPDAHQMLTNSRVRGLVGNFPLIDAEASHRMLANAQKRATATLQETLRTSKERDEVVDVWRTMVDDARLDVLQLRRDQELQLFEQMLRIWLADWLQAPRADPRATGAVQQIPLPEEQRAAREDMLVPLVDAATHPSQWRLGIILATHLDPLVNPPGGMYTCGAATNPRLLRIRLQLPPGAESLHLHGLATHCPPCTCTPPAQVIADVDPVTEDEVKELEKLQDWTDSGAAHLRLHPASSDAMNPDLLLALNRNAGMDAELEAEWRNALDLLLGRAQSRSGPAWRGRYARQVRRPSAHV